MVKFNTYEQASQDTLNAIENDFYITKLLQDTNRIHISKTKKPDKDQLDEKFFPCTIHKIQNLYIHHQTYIMEKELFEARTLYQQFNGEPLHDLIKFFKIAIGLCNCLLQIHKQGIVHLDITPNSILFDDDNNELKIFNFENGGFIHTRGQFHFHRDKLYSTFEYIGAENTLGVQTDIYSLGAVFYFLLSGKKPFRGSTPKELIKQHALEQLDKIAYVPQRVFHIILSMMRRNNSKTYMSLSEVILDLECIFSNKPFSSVQDYTFTHRFYGRESDLSVIKTRYAKFKSTRKSIMTVIHGQPGIGKTMLIEQFSKIFQIQFLKINCRYNSIDQLKSTKSAFVFIDELHFLEKHQLEIVKLFIAKHSHPCFIVLSYNTSDVHIYNDLVSDMQREIPIKLLELEPLPEKISNFFINDKHAHNYTHGIPLHMHEASLLPPHLRQDTLENIILTHLNELPTTILSCLKLIADIPGNSYSSDEIMKILNSDNRLVAKGNLYAILKTGFIVEVSYNVFAFLHYIYKTTIQEMNATGNKKSSTTSPPLSSSPTPPAEHVEESDEDKPTPKHVLLRQMIEEESKKDEFVERLPPIKTKNVVANSTTTKVEALDGSTPDGPPPPLPQLSPQPSFDLTVQPPTPEHKVIVNSKQSGYDDNLSDMDVSDTSEDPENPSLKEEKLLGYIHVLEKKLNKIEVIKKKLEEGYLPTERLLDFLDNEQRYRDHKDKLKQKVVMMRLSKQSPSMNSFQQLINNNGVLPLNGQFPNMMIQPLPNLGTNMSAPSVASTNTFRPMNVPTSPSSVGSGSLSGILPAAPVMIPNQSHLLQQIQQLQQQQMQQQNSGAFSPYSPTFQNVLPSNTYSVASSVISDASGAPHPVKHFLQEQAKTVTTIPENTTIWNTPATVLICRIRNFSRINSQTNAKQTFASISRFSRTVCRAVENHTGFVDSIQNNTVSAVFPPLDKNSTMLYAVNSAMDIISQLYQSDQLDISLAIHHGDVSISKFDVELPSNQSQKKQTMVVGPGLAMAQSLNKVSTMLGATTLISESIFNSLSKLEVDHQVKMRWVGRFELDGIPSQSLYDLYDESYSLDGSKTPAVEVRLMIDLFSQLLFKDCIIKIRQLVNKYPHDQLLFFYKSAIDAYAELDLPLSWRGDIKLNRSGKILPYGKKLPTNKGNNTNVNVPIASSQDPPLVGDTTLEDVFHEEDGSRYKQEIDKLRERLSHQNSEISKLQDEILTEKQVPLSNSKSRLKRPTWLCACLPLFGRKSTHPETNDVMTEYRDTDSDHEM